MGSACTGFTLTDLRLSILTKKYEYWGLRSEFIQLDNGATKMHCWTPMPMSEAGVWSIPNSKPHLVLLQGFAPNGMLFWENQVPKLSKDFNVFVPDLVFLGRSVTSCKERWTESFQAECIMKMLQFLGLQEDVNFVGSGYGGLVAFRIAQFYPKFVNKVVFTNTGICMAPNDYDALLVRHRLQHISHLFIPESVEEFKFAMASAPHWKPWLPKFVYEDMFEVLYKDHQQERRQLLDDLTIETGKDLPRLAHDKKFLILWGEHDEVFKPELANKLQRHLGKRAKVIVITLGEVH